MTPMSTDTTPVPAETKTARPVGQEALREARHPWCQPGDDPERKWLVTFEDADRTFAMFTDETEAREYFRKANVGGWNCYLFQAAALATQPQPTTGPGAEDQGVRSYRAYQQWKFKAGYVSPNMVSFQAGFEAAEAAITPSTSKAAPLSDEETWETIAQWCEETFGPVTPERIARRAAEEMSELLIDPERVEEAADVLICLSRYPGLWDAVQRKMKVNRARVWRLTGDGCGYHVPAPPAPADEGRQTVPAELCMCAACVAARKYGENWTTPPVPADDATEGRS